MGSGSEQQESIGKRFKDTVLGITKRPEILFGRETAEWTFQSSPDPGHPENLEIFTAQRAVWRKTIRVLMAPFSGGFDVQVDYNLDDFADAPLENVLFFRAAPSYLPESEGEPLGLSLCHLFGRPEVKSFGYFTTLYDQKGLLGVANLRTCGKYPRIREEELWMDYSREMILPLQKVVSLYTAGNRMKRFNLSAREANGGVSFHLEDRVHHIHLGEFPLVIEDIQRDVLQLIRAQLAGLYQL